MKHPGWQTIEYVKENGEVPIDKYLDSLPEKHEAKLMRSIQILEEFGPGVGMPHVRHLENDVYELRTIFASNIFRTLFFHYKHGKLILLHGFTKKQQKTPRKEIERAKRYQTDFLKQQEGGRK